MNICTDIALQPVAESLKRMVYLALARKVVAAPVTRMRRLNEQSFHSKS